MEMATSEPKMTRPEEAARKTRPKALSPMCDRAPWMTMRPSRIFLTTPRNGPPSDAPRLASEFFQRWMVSVRVALRVSRLLSRNSVLRAASAELRKDSLTRSMFRLRRWSSWMSRVFLNPRFLTTVQRSTESAEHGSPLPYW